MKKVIFSILLFIVFISFIYSEERNFDTSHGIFINISGWGYGTPGPGFGYEHFFRLNKYLFLTLSAGLTFRMNYNFFMELPVALGIGFGKSNHFYRPRLLTEFQYQYINYIYDEKENTISLSCYIDAAHFVFKHFGFSFMITGVNIFAFESGTFGNNFEAGSGDFIFTPLRITYLELKFRF